VESPISFPIEVNTADYEMLLRIPGMGVTYAQRILVARRQCRVTHDVLKKLGVSMRRSKYFLTADGKFAGCHGSSPTAFAEVLRSPLEEIV